MDQEQKPKKLNDGDILGILAPLEITAAEGQGKSSKFSTTAYNGGPMWLDSWMYQVIVDLKGLQIPKQNIPILQEHNPSIDSVSGMTDSIKIEGSSIIETGKLFSEADPGVAKIVAKAKAGFEWQASIGAKVIRRDFLDEGQTAEVNGIEAVGPVYIARESVLMETSIVTFGADESTNVQIAAKNKNRKGEEMDPKTENKEPEKKVIQAELGIDGKVNDAEIKQETAKPAETIKATAATENPAVDPEIQAKRDAAANETLRISAIGKIEGVNDFPDIKAEAEKGGWSPDQAELKIIRASRPEAPAVNAKQKNSNVEVLECAMRMNSAEKTSSVEAAYKPEILDQADKMRGTSIRGLIQACCTMEGIQTPALNANPVDWINAAFSTVSFSTLMSVSANKIIMSAFKAVKGMEVIQKLTKKLNANDFKAHSATRLESSLVFEELGAGGEIKHGLLSDTGYPYSVVTYGKMLGLTRNMMVNDDLGAFTDILQLLGRGAALKEMDLFWALVIANTDSFFGASNNNVNTAALGINLAGYNAMNSLIELQKDTYDNEIYIEPRYVVTPVALKAAAMAMFKDTNLTIEYTGVTTTSSKKQVATRNTYEARFEPLSSPKLDSSSVSTWYGFADPADLPAFGVAYLNGKETPVVEEVALSGEYLGKAWRGYIDFGVAQLDPKAAARMSDS